jgi:hypothetical protein
MDKHIYDLDALSENFSTGVGEQIKKFSNIASITVGKHFGDLEKLPSLSNSMSEMVKNFPLLNLSKNISERMKNLQGPELYVSNFPSPIYSAEKFNWNKSSKKLEPVVELPPETQWQHLQCHFTNERTLSVSCNSKYIGRYGHDELKFCMGNTQAKIPDAQWKLLYTLATFYSYEGGTLVKPTVDVLTNSLKIKKPALYTRIRALSLKLQSVFGLQDSPFYEYQPHQGYQLKFTLLPEEYMRGSGSLRDSGGSFLEGITEETDNEI